MIQLQISSFYPEFIWAPFMLSLVLVAVCLSLNILARKSIQKKSPISVNYHFTRRCNYECGFCFHTSKTSHMLSIEQAKQGLLRLKQAGMRKINFAGGEPFLYPKFLGQLVEYCKLELKLESVSIISNGSLIKESWMRKYSQHLDVLGKSPLLQPSFKWKVKIAPCRHFMWFVQWKCEYKDWTRQGPAFREHI